MSNKKGVYDDDDFYDYDDADEDYYGNYGDFDPGESQVAGKQSTKVFDELWQSQVQSSSEVSATSMLV